MTDFLENVGLQQEHLDAVVALAATDFAAPLRGCSFGSLLAVQRCRAATGLEPHGSAREVGSGLTCIHDTARAQQATSTGTHVTTDTTDQCIINPTLHRHGRDATACVSCSCGCNHKANTPS